MKFLILGGNGFIGSNFAAFLKMHNEEVTIFDRMEPEKRLDGVEYIAGDFFCDEELQKVICDKDVIVHAISTINPGNSNERYLFGYEKDFMQTIKMCSWLKDTEKKILFLSSGGTVYGDHSIQPIEESFLPSPINHYANIKLSIENALRIFHIQNKLNTTIARITNPYGPGQDFTKGVGFIDAVLKNSMSGIPVHIYGDGSNIRDYIYIDDVCECLYALSGYIGPEIIFNVSSGVGKSQNDIMDIAAELGLKVERIYEESRSVDVRKIILSNKKIKDTFGVCFMSPEEGIKRYYEYLCQ